MIGLIGIIGKQFPHFSSRNCCVVVVVMITTTTPHNTTSPQSTSTLWFSGNICAVLVLARPKLKDCFHQVIIDEGFLTFRHNIGHLTTFAFVFIFSKIKFRRLKKFRATDFSFQLLIALAFFDTLYIICGGINYTFRFLYMKVITFELMQTFLYKINTAKALVFIFFSQGLWGGRSFWQRVRVQNHLPGTYLIFKT